MLCQDIVDFSMAGYRLFQAGSGIDIDVMPISMSVEDATLFFKMSD